jgi:predicted ABC-type ATPase
MRVFAGPNGSGKTTIINAVRKYKVHGVPVDFGIYINADEIVVALNTKSFSFAEYSIETSNNEFKEVAFASGLINSNFTKSQFEKSYHFSSGRILLADKVSDERLAQILADFLRKKLLKEKKKFSFETVFSHESKLDIIREAVKTGYKVYLYFVSTSSPEINKHRVEVRIAEGGHSVPPAKIESRYSVLWICCLKPLNYLTRHIFLITQRTERREIFLPILKK